jgi:hypothetical protein
MFAGSDKSRDGVGTRVLTWAGCRRHGVGSSDSSSTASAAQRSSVDVPSPELLTPIESPCMPMSPLRHVVVVQGCGALLLADRVLQR